MKFEAQKGCRVKRYFRHIEIIPNNEEERWSFYENIGRNGEWVNENNPDSEKIAEKYEVRSNMDSVIKNYGTLKSLLRRIKKTTKNIPKGTKVRLGNLYVGYDIIITL